MTAAALRTVVSRTLAGSALAGTAIVTAPDRAHPQMVGTITRPARGVICDRPAMTCFDNRGASVDLTRRHLGNNAAQRLSARLSGRPPAPEFELSNGAVCNVGGRTCWTSSRRNRIDSELTRDLFSNAQTTRPDDKEVSKSRGLCSITQRGRALFDGSCDLRIVSRDSGISRYSVSAGDGRRYVFRWSDIKLVATREHSLLPLAQPRSGRKGDQIDQLFRGTSN